MVVILGVSYPGPLGDPFFNTGLPIARTKWRNNSTKCNDLVSKATGVNLIISNLYFSYGWLIDATARYPMQTVKPNCGNKTGVIGTTAQRNKTSERYSAYCYKH